MINNLMNIIFNFLFFLVFSLIVFLYPSCSHSGDPILMQRKNNQVGNYVIDMNRTEWGEYEEEKENYKDISIFFTSDMTFKVNRSVPFLPDTCGVYVIRGKGQLSDIRFSNLIKKHGDTYSGNWLWECWEDKNGDSVTAIIGPVPQQNEHRLIPKLFFKKISK